MSRNEVVPFFLYSRGKRIALESAGVPIILNLILRRVVKETMAARYFHVFITIAVFAVVFSQMGK